MIEEENKLSISRQCELLGKQRSWYYDKSKKSKKIIEKENKEKRVILEIIGDYPAYGYRRVSLESKERGDCIKEKRTRRLMLEMGVSAVYPKPRLTKGVREDKKYPYLLKNMKVERANQVWQTDITYIKLPGGRIYLTALLDIYSRKTLAWELSNTLDTGFCIRAFDKAVRKYGSPEILNTDQGSQFTSKEWTEQLKKHKIKISMCGKGRAADNIYIERVWRTVKYEDIYLKNYETVKELRRGLTEYFKFYNKKRFHQSLNYMRPDEVYYGTKFYKEAV